MNRQTQTHQLHSPFRATRSSSPFTIRPNTPDTITNAPIYTPSATLSAGTMRADSEQTPDPTLSTISDYTANLDHPPPDYTRRPAPLTRDAQSTTSRCPHGVLSGGCLIKILETLSSGNNETHKRMCAWLIDHYITPFGRVHNLDGLVVSSADDTAFILLAHGMWIDREGWHAKGDVFWVPGLEPVEMVGVDGAMRALPVLGTRLVERWTAGEVQYRDGVSLRKRMAVLVAAGWRDGLGWMREIWDKDCEGLGVCVTKDGELVRCAEGVEQ